LGPLLFIIFVNDMEIGVGGKLFKFTDDTKLVQAIKGLGDNVAMQRNLHKLSGWVDVNNMAFNVEKSRIMHFGSKNGNFWYQFGGNWLESSELERDLGVLVSVDLKAHRQSFEVRNRANRILGAIRKNVQCKSREVIRTLYTALVRPHFEYCVQAWPPFYKKDIVILETVQKN